MLSRMLVICVVVFCIVFVTGKAEAEFAVDGQTVGLWHMDEGSDTMAFDATANAYDFSPVGSGIGLDYTWSSGYEMGGLSVPAIVNGSYLYANIGTDKFQYQVTAEAWIRPTSADSDGSQIIALLYGFSLATVDGGSRLRFITYSDARWLDVYASATSPVDLYDGNWHHVAGIFDGRLDASGRIHLYLFIDGKLAASNSFTAATSTVVGFGAGLTYSDLYLGANAWAPSAPQHFVGDIDEVRISNVNRYLPDTTMIGLWHMDEGTGTTISDSSGYGNDLAKGDSYSWASPGYNGSGFALQNDSNDYCNGTLVTGTKPVNALTIDARIKPTNIDTDQSIIAGEAWMFNFFLYGTPTDCILKMMAVTDKDFGGIHGNYPSTTMPDAERLFDGNWHRVCGTFDGIPDENNKVYIRIYVDNLLASETAFDSNVPVGFYGGGDPYFYIGQNPWIPGSTTQNFIGSIDEVSFSTVAKRYGCGSLGYLAGDVDKNCKVDFSDFAALAANWLKCNNPDDPNYNM
ncbi:MAG: LamG domain-containing protein [Sedimentisphaerales bacterium]